ncbi:MAG: TIGR00282 family metallophosphoesterase [Chromatiales bacterium]|jgi:metallophosphoesterase (TIGR00282 family)
MSQSDRQILNCSRIKLLFIGDVIGEPGRRAIAAALPYLRASHDIDLVIANAENSAAGKGVTPAAAEALFELGVDVLTNGNHAWDRPEALDYIASEPRLLRPYNYPETTPGSGWLVVDTARGYKVAVLNLLGNVFMSPQLGCPFAAADHALASKPDDVKLVVVDLHAEAASEKMALGWHLDGRVSAVFGTHTHVPTADQRILPGGTAYITDVGMTGCYDSIVGMDVQQSFARLIHKLPEPLEVADGEATFSAVLVHLDVESGVCRHIQRLRIDESEVLLQDLEAWAAF